MNSSRFWFEQALENKRRLDLAEKKISLLQLNKKCLKMNSILKRTRRRELRKIMEKQKVANESKVTDIVRGIKSIEDIASVNLQGVDTTTLQIKQLLKLQPIAKEFSQMIGLKSVKKKIFEILVEQLLFAVQKSKNPCLKREMGNITMVGAPGTGKTTLCKLLGRLFGASGMLSKGHIVVARRVDLVGEYVGHTAVKTLAVLESAKGGVLLLDEIYALSGDVFAKEAVNVIVDYTSTVGGDILIVCAGYKHEVNTLFLSQNPGLERRFTTTLELTDYSASELSEIFMSMVEKAGWKVEAEKKQISEFIVSKHKEYVNFSGDMENLLLHSKQSASLRVWSTFSDTKELMLDDVMAGHLCLCAKRNEAGDFSKLMMYQ